MKSRVVRSASLVVLCLGLALAAVPAAQADTVTFTQSDPQGDGGGGPDISQASAQVDFSTGAVAATMSFYAPLPANFSGYQQFGVYLGAHSGRLANCSAYAAGTTQIFASTTGSAPLALQWSINGPGYSQTYGHGVPGVSADRMQLSMAFVEPTLTQHAVTCMSASADGSAAGVDDRLGPVASDTARALEVACQGQPVMMALDGLAPTAVSGRTTDFSVNVAYSDKSQDAQQSGDRLLDGRLTISGGDIAPYVDEHADSTYATYTIHMGAQPQDVVLRWHQLDGGTDTQCEYTAKQTVTPIVGAHASVSRSLGSHGTAELSIKRGPCDSTALESLVVRSGKASTATADPCKNWMHGLKVSNLAVGHANGRTIRFVARKTGSAPVAILRAGKVVARFRLHTRVKRIRASGGHRVWEGTDAFVNYCINRTKQIYSEHHRLYCLTTYTPAHTIKSAYFTKA